MIPREILAQIRRIQITTSRMVTDVFAGQYQSVFRGRGMEFDEVREYQPGDEIRSIDWNVTARMGHPYIKKFVEERELTVMLLLDMSGSSYFGTVNKLKSRIAAEICSLLALAAIRNNDKIGFIAFTDKIEKFVPPRKGLRHALRVVRESLYFKPEAKGTNISEAVEYLSKVTTRKTVTFIISDFYPAIFKSGGTGANLKKALSIANKRHDIVAITITDPKEIEMPDVGIVELEDAEQGESYIVDTSDSALRKEYRKNALRKFGERKKLFNLTNVDNVDVRTDIPYDKTLFKFFRMRERKLR